MDKSQIFMDPHQMYQRTYIGLGMWVNSEYKVVRKPVARNFVQEDKYVFYWFRFNVLNRFFESGRFKKVFNSGLLGYVWDRVPTGS